MLIQELSYITCDSLLMSDSVSLGNVDTGADQNFSAQNCELPTNIMNKDFVTLTCLIVTSIVSVS